MGYYLAKMVGGNSALLVEINDDIDLQNDLLIKDRIKFIRMLNLSLVRCYLQMGEIIPESILLPGIQVIKLVKFSFIMQIFSVENIFDDLQIYFNLKNKLFELEDTKIGTSVKIKINQDKKIDFSTEGKIQNNVIEILNKIKKINLITFLDEFNSNKEISLTTKTKKILLLLRQTLIIF